ncbi:sodium pump decarboxylases, gamma subunit [Lachnospiraceae bacterium XBB1006]|nr:sodium pump decarboxylases, gamma subunit [Lachnospiraceae bacterium XBB1006]
MLHALLNVALGMGSVFIVLIIISLIIQCFNIFPMLEAKFKKNKKATEEFKNEPIRETVIDEETSDDEAVVAAIMAAITAYSGMSQDEFVVRSIVRR